MTLPRLRKYIAFERLLARLLVIAPERYVLKGGYALDVRLHDRARSTQDLDLAIPETEETVVRDLTGAAELDIADYFSFTFTRSHVLDNLEEARAVRFSIETRLAKKKFETFRLDVGVEGLGTTVPEKIIGSDLLAFAGIAVIELPVIPIAQHVAEKIHAYTGTYGLGRGSSRVKDLVDLVLISELLTLNAADLTDALTSTFQIRGVHMMPSRFLRPPADWETTYAGLAREVGIAPTTEAGWEKASAFLNPVLCGEVAPEAVWSPDGRRWVVH